MSDDILATDSEDHCKLLTQLIEAVTLDACWHRPRIRNDNGPTAN